MNQFEKAVREDIIKNGLRLGGPSSEPLFWTSPKENKAAYDIYQEATAKDGGGVSTLIWPIAEKLCLAGHVCNALYELRDYHISDEVVDWLMQDLPWDHAWFKILSPCQKSSKLGRSWSWNERKLYGFPISRLEYWTTIWISHDGMEYGDGDYNDGGMCTAVSDTFNWSEEMRSFNRRQWSFACDIMKIIWGGYWDPDATDGSDEYMTKAGNATVDSPGFTTNNWMAQTRYDGYARVRDSSKTTNSLLKFVEMCSMNQGKGPHFKELWWGMANEGEESNPWATEGNGWAKKQWIYTGKEDNGVIDNDPITFGIFKRLLFTKDGYEAPFNIGGSSGIEASWRERKAFAEPTDTSKTMGQQTAINFAPDRWATAFTATTFLEQTLAYLKRDESLDIQVWDGKFAKSANDAKTEPWSVRVGAQINNNGTITSNQSYSWAGRGVNEDDDSDTGLFYYPVSKSTVKKQFSESYNMSERRHFTGQGVAKMKWYMMPTPYGSYDGNWLATPGNNKYNIFIEYKEFIESLISTNYVGYFKTMARKKQNIGLQDKEGDTTYFNIPMWTFKDSGFTDWEGAVKGGVEGMLEHYHLTPDGKGNAPLSEKQGAFAEAISMIPKTVRIDGKAPIEISPTLDFVADVNRIAGKEVLKGSLFDFEPVVDNEDAKKMCDDIKEVFLEFAGSEEKGRGPKEMQATAKWFTENFLSTSLVPKSVDGDLITKLKLDDGEGNAEGKAALKRLLGFGWGPASTIEFARTGSPWTVQMAPGGLGEVPFSQILRTYQAAAYAALLYYRIAAGTGKTDVRVTADLVWEMYAYKCAHHFWRVWERVLHDNQVGNMYAVLVVVLANTDFKSADALAALEALADLLRDADDDLVKKIGTEPEPESPEGEVTAADKDQRERFYKQCALLLNMHRLVNNYSFSGAMHATSDKIGYTSYNGRIHLVTNDAPADGQKNTILNKMITPRPSTMKEFTKITPAKAAELSPYLRFFRVWNDADGKLCEVEFDFPKYPERRIDGQLSLGDIQRKKKGIEPPDPSDFDRGDGVGMVEFSWEADGETPATASKFINATLTLHFQTFDDFIRKRYNKVDTPFRWVDMFISPTSMIAKGTAPGTNTPHTLRYDAEYYRIRVDVGYHTNSSTANLNDALATQNRSFFLVLKDNEININEDMSVTIKANYGAYIEEAMDSNKFNALATPELIRKQEQYRVAWNKATADWKAGKCNDMKLRRVRNMINADLEKLVKMQHRSIMTNLLKLERIFYVDFQPTAIESFRQNGVFDQIPFYRNADVHTAKPGESSGKRLQELMNQKADKNKKRDAWMEANEPQKDHRVYYFYFGDLIYLINSTMYDAGDQPWNASLNPFKQKNVSGAENSRLLLFDFDYHNPLTEAESSRYTINIAMIPISVDFFFQWYVNNIIKEEVFHIGVGAFIRLLLVELITEAMAEVCMTNEEGHYVNFKHGSISVAGHSIDVPGDEKQFIDPITSMLFQSKDKVPNPRVFDVAQYYKQNTDGNEQLELPFKSLPEDEALVFHDLNCVEGQFQYMYIYGDFADPYHPGMGDEESDAERGTYHLNLAQNNGLVKNISFEKTNIKYQREARMAVQGQAGLTQLSAVYNCEIKMLGNTLFLPGQEVWVNPYGFGGETFGKPQDPPLAWDPTAQEINDLNDKIKGAEKGGTTSEEMAMIADSIDELEAKTDGREEEFANTGKVSKPSGDLKTEISSYANVMGIGGYQVIIKVSNTIKPGSFETSLRCMHTYSGYPKIKKSVTLAEFRDGRPKSISQADSTTGDNACMKVLGDRENAALRSREGNN